VRSHTGCIATIDRIDTQQSLRDAAWSDPPAQSLTLDLTTPPPAPFRGARGRRGRILVAVAAVVLGAAVWTVNHQDTRARPAPAPPLPASALPQPVGNVLTLYRFTVESGPAEVVTFFDTSGRWCRATWFDHEARSASHYRCRSTDLPLDGFGRVDSASEMPTWDGMRLWVQGMVTDDVARVTVAYRDGSVATAQLLDEPLARGVLFTAARPYYSPPAVLRAYNAYDELVQTLNVRGPSPLPWTPVP